MMHEWDGHWENPVTLATMGGPSCPVVGKFLADCATVEDWGCGGGVMRQHIVGRYLGVDGSQSPAADVLADLRSYTSLADGVILRHVLEHNDEWERVLANAVFTAQRKLAIVLFTPMQESTHVLFREADFGNVPVIGFAPGDIFVHTLDWRTDLWCRISSPSTQFGEETLMFLTRP